MISVYICGEVNNPGFTRSVPVQSLMMLLNSQADLLPEPSLRELILCMRFTQICRYTYLPKRNLEDTGNLGDLQDDVIREDDSVCVWGDSQSSGEDGSGGQAALSGHTETVNINTASREELMMLPGIGDVISSAIIQYREKTPLLP